MYQCCCAGKCNKLPVAVVIVCETRPGSCVASLTSCAVSVCLFWRLHSGLHPGFSVLWETIFWRCSLKMFTRASSSAHAFSVCATVCHCWWSALLCVKYYIQHILLYSTCTQIVIACFSVEEEASTHQCKFENLSPAFGFNLFCAVCTIACLVQHFMRVFERVWCSLVDEILLI